MDEWEKKDTSGITILMDGKSIYSNVVEATATDTEVILECRLTKGKGKPIQVATLILPFDTAGKLGFVLSKLLTTTQTETEEENGNTTTSQP